MAKPSQKRKRVTPFAKGGRGNSSNVGPSSSVTVPEIGSPLHLTESKLDVLAYFKKYKLVILPNNSSPDSHKSLTVRSEAAI